MPLDRGPDHKRRGGSHIVPMILVYDRQPEPYTLLRCQLRQGSDGQESYGAQVSVLVRRLILLNYER